MRSFSALSARSADCAAHSSHVMPAVTGMV
jgi:hypothetical protein